MNRRDFLFNTLILGAMSTQLSAFMNAAAELPAAQRQPVVFIGHGSPTNAIEDNAFTRALKAFGQTLPPPQAVLVVSAHWETKGTYVSTHAKPPTIYDFGGFPKEMYQQTYPAPGAPSLAAQTAALSTAEYPILTTPLQGLDHGAWTVLKHIFPKAQTPVFQMSIDYTRPLAYHAELAKRLAVLRDKGVLILGSGNIVHNLGKLDWTSANPVTADWALAFDQKVKKDLDNQDLAALSRLSSQDLAYRTAHPSPEHYIPLLYAAALRQKGESLVYLYEGFQYANISMRSFVIGK